MAVRIHGERFLEAPVDGPTRGITLAAVALLLVTYLFPLWNLTMFAPQYPDGLRLDIYSYTLTGGNAGQDVKEVNVLNHYIGMRDLDRTAFTEFQWMPFVIGGIGLLMLRAAVHGTAASLLDVVMLFVYFGAFSGWSFAFKLYQYGHQLAPDAAIKVAPFMPPVFGYRQIANFEVYPYPRAGTYAMLASMALLGVALLRVWRTWRTATPKG